MTPIPLSAVQSLRLTCKHYGVALVMPLATTKEVPRKCFNCYTEFTAVPIQDFMREFRYMKDAAGRADVTFLAGIEHDAE